MLQLSPPRTKLFLRRRTESRAKRIIWGDLQQPIQDLLHPALGPAVRHSVNLVPVRLHVRPYQQLETLHESVIARSARHRIRQILLQASRLQTAEYR